MNANPQELADRIREQRRTQGTLGIPQPKPDADEERVLTAVSVARTVDGGGLGNVGLGFGGAPSTHKPRPDLCESLGHPGETYNPWTDKTWCLCGAVVVADNTAGHESCCCGGRLLKCRHEVLA
ncbi:MAG: hypothetical protein JWO15_3868 [Sphingomonadales bacterium]|nr:hypothetical protein [Sphingomonadales bacterium]